MQESDMKRISITRALLVTLLLQSDHFAAQDSDSLHLHLNPIIQRGDGENCPDGLLETARAEIHNLVLEAIVSRERVCTCGAAAAGWTRVAFLNMTDPSQNCPGHWRLISSPKRTCGKGNDGCSSATFSSDGTTYSQVCGRVVAYQYGTTDAFWHAVNLAYDINNHYIDGGVSITHGHPRQHVWTLASGWSQQRTDTLGCSCNHGANYNLPSWIGEDYFCDSAPVVSSASNVFYSDNPLWDGVGCDESSTTCCQFNNPPWFCKRLPQPTSDDIEIRLCADNPDEDTPIELLEIYIH